MVPPVQGVQHAFDTRSCGFAVPPGVGWTTWKRFPDIHQISLTPRHGINAYLVGDILVDAGIKQSVKKILKALDGRPVSAHALTHAHQDHAGGSRGIIEALSVPFWVGATDAPAARSGKPVVKKTLMGSVLSRAGGWDGAEVARELREGEELGHGFTVIDVPGHSPGHVAFWRERDRVLIAGDVLFNVRSLVTLQPGLREPIEAFTIDPEQNRASIRRIADLEPAVVGFGHGPVLRDAAPKLRAFAAKL